MSNQPEQKQLLALGASEEEKSSHRQLAVAEKPQPEPSPAEESVKKGHGGIIAVILLLLAAAAAAVVFVLPRLSAQVEPEPVEDPVPVIPVEVVDDRMYGITHDHDYRVGFSEYKGDREIADFSATLAKWSDIDGRSGTFVARWTAPGVKPYGFELENGMKTACGLSFGDTDAYSDMSNPAEKLVSSQNFVSKLSSNLELKVDGKSAKLSKMSLSSTSRQEINGWKLYQFEGTVSGTVVTWDASTQSNAQKAVEIPFIGYGLPFSSFDYGEDNPKQNDGFAYSITFDPADGVRDELVYVALNTAMSFRVQKCDASGTPLADYEFDYSSRTYKFDNADRDQ